jgi:homoserine kinase type II
MAVYTKINNKDVLSLGANYNIDKITKFDGIKKGIENTNYLLRLAFFHGFNGKTK